jgi:hypothetical protein
MRAHKSQYGWRKAPDWIPLERADDRRSQVGGHYSPTKLTNQNRCLGKRTIYDDKVSTLLARCTPTVFVIELHSHRARASWPANSRSGEVLLGQSDGVPCRVEVGSASRCREPLLGVNEDVGDLEAEVGALRGVGNGYKFTRPDPSSLR